MDCSNLTLCLLQDLFIGESKNSFKTSRNKRGHDLDFFAVDTEVILRQMNII